MESQCSDRKKILVGTICCVQRTIWRILILERLDSELFANQTNIVLKYSLMFLSFSSYKYGHLHSDIGITMVLDNF